MYPSRAVQAQKKISSLIELYHAMISRSSVRKSSTNCATRPSRARHIFVRESLCPAFTANWWHYFLFPLLRLRGGEANDKACIMKKKRTRSLYCMRYQPEAASLFTFTGSISQHLIVVGDSLPLIFKFKNSVTVFPIRLFIHTTQTYKFTPFD